MGYISVVDNDQRILRMLSRDNYDAHFGNLCSRLYRRQWSGRSGGILRGKCGVAKDLMGSVWKD
jgi:hypothetical protein